MAEIWRFCARIDEDAAAQGVVAEALDHGGGQRVEHRLARMQPDALRRVVWVGGAIHAEAFAHGDVVGTQRDQQGVQRARLLRHEGEEAVQVATDGQTEEFGAGRNELAHVAGR